MNLIPLSVPEYRGVSSLNLFVRKKSRADNANTRHVLLSPILPISFPYSSLASSSIASNLLVSSSFSSRYFLLAASRYTSFGIWMTLLRSCLPSIFSAECVTTAFKNNAMH
ncbi:ORF61 [White spot syndrome virus]|uniref:Wsv480 n=3 Tax=White spot syndrome virus TaxID=342409 RepID=Q8VAE5_WSSVS|nr:wsv480 [Shrimp white spot syndrome virus]AFX59854.1 wsv480 [White spot syndrome virus]AAL33481.1 wsv480 [Shrimp white spot syndrome virus]AAL88875.1 WSSV007 [Shrimp white spot syndrome virus]ATU83601.1 ORF61 [White spot syndrome virus]AWQ62287.1 wsv480 [Shrimp white spot syndrome virus]